MRHSASADDFRVVQIEYDDVFERRIDVREENKGETTSDGQQLPDLSVDAIHGLNGPGVGVSNQDFCVTFEGKRLN